jgi:hypothetical protein
MGRPRAGRPARRRLAGLALALALGLAACARPPTPAAPSPTGPAATATPPPPGQPGAAEASLGGPPAVRAPADRKRGLHLPITPLGAADFQALELVDPGSVVLLSAQLGDPDPTGEVVEDVPLERWLDAHRDVVPIVRMWPVKQPESPARLARRMLGLHHRYPWVRTFIPCNEPDIEWPAATWPQVAAWTLAVWEELERAGGPAGAGELRLLYPPFSQWSALDPEHVGYDAVRPAVEWYLDHGGGLAGHEYWDRGNVYLVEDGWPAWLRARLAGATFFVTEAGYRPDGHNGVPDEQFGQELIRFAERSRAGVVAPFILSDGLGRYEEQALVTRGGWLRPPLYAWAGWLQGR